eukprot:gnl/MRDRNA2_/MRDRNA2_84187_c0_seq8.p1 gnl/MRDRNA2_/MRDRNA2_84187_c0~~gnl/MRDRNA2_/MRDRNA2_84187_c0_seq8.p1  ORF type:complete len:195 (-),score=45.41 gnl/MRDRNA2_/MRDRNA2_84187_c0_seq8:26-610(-)
MVLTWNMKNDNKMMDNPMMKMMMMRQQMMMEMMGKMMGGGKGMGKGEFPRTYEVDKSGGELGEFVGTIKSGGAKYGFIECPEADKGDIFVHADERKAFKKGQSVKFTLVLTKDGKPNAINLKPEITEELGEFTGTIKSGGPRYGFIECAEAGKGDIFLHADERKGYRQGQTVKFTLVLTKEGKPTAINLKSGLN